MSSMFTAGATQTKMESSGRCKLHNLCFCIQRLHDADGAPVLRVETGRQLNANTNTFKRNHVFCPILLHIRQRSLCFSAFCFDNLFFNLARRG